MVKNRYEIVGDTVVIYLNETKSKNPQKTIVDLSALETILTYPGRWSARPTTHNNSYYVIGSRKDKTVLLHRYLTNPPKGMVVDHINHDTLDNRYSNLRVVTYQENSQNVKVNTKNLSGFRGVSLLSDGKWLVSITTSGQFRKVGIYGNKDDAIKAADEVRVKEMPGYISIFNKAIVSKQEVTK